MSLSDRGWFKKLFRTLPAIDKADKRSGLTFVNILFGLVVTAAVSRLALLSVQWQKKGVHSIKEVRLSHLIVAIVLSTLSWVGYYQSQQNPPFLIKFINIPFEQFVLDVLMVTAYFITVVLAEGKDIRNSARPETALIAVSFFLYLLWDWCGYRLGRDQTYNQVLNASLGQEEKRDVETRYGPRRMVTVIFFFLTVILALSVWCADPTSSGSVIGIDVMLVVILILYRLAKPLSDPLTEMRA